jgi:hypothetical protein
MQVPEMCTHILFCCHTGWVKILMHTIDIMDDWLMGAGTESPLPQCLVKYACSQGGVMMAEVCQGMGELYKLMKANQNCIGWRQFMEGIVCKKICGIQNAYLLIEGMHMSAA